MEVAPATISTKRALSRQVIQAMLIMLIVFSYSSKNTASIEHKRSCYFPYLSVPESQSFNILVSNSTPSVMGTQLLKAMKPGYNSIIRL